MLVVRDIVKEYKDKKAVDGVSISFDNGIYGFLGANGAGKTTLINIIAGVTKHTSGEVLWDNVNTVQMGANYRKLLGYLPQKISLYPDFSVLDYLQYMCVLKNYKDKNAIKCETDRILEMVNLTAEKNKKIRALSGGMQQRTAIAQSFIGNPKVILLDEPTVGLDPEERIRFKDNLNQLKNNAIIIVSTHILSDVSELADVLCMFKSGHLIYNGKRDEWESENIDKKYLDVMGDSVDKI